MVRAGVSERSRGTRTCGGMNTFWGGIFFGLSHGEVLKISVCAYTVVSMFL